MNATAISNSSKSDNINYDEEIEQIKKCIAENKTRIEKCNKFIECLKSDGREKAIHKVCYLKALQAEYETKKKELDDFIEEYNNAIDESNS